MNTENITTDLENSKKWEAPVLIFDFFGITETPKDPSVIEGTASGLTS